MLKRTDKFYELAQLQMKPRAYVDTWVTCSKPNPRASLRLLCFPYAGGGASIFRSWPDILPTDIEVYIVQLPGRDNRLLEPPFTRLVPLVQTLVQALSPYLDVPFAFFGHSMGALVSFELARELRRNGASPPTHLLVSGCRAPQIPRRDASAHQLPDAEFMNYLQHIGGTPELVLQNTELMALLLPTLRADFVVVDTYIYVPEAPFDCAISAYGGLQDRTESRDDIVAWQTQTHGPFTCRMFPSDHFFLHKAQMLLLQAISRDLSRPQPSV